MQGSQSTAPGYMLTITACMETGSTVKQQYLFMTKIEVQRSTLVPLKRKRIFLGRFEMDGRLLW